MLQHGSYTLLIDACYDREQFPTMDEAIEWTWASSTAEIEAVQFVLRKFFTLEDGIYVQARIQEEIAEYHAKSETNQRIAIEREAKRREGFTKRAPGVNEPPPNQEPITNNHKPVNQKPSSASPPGGYPEEFETAWDAYPPRPGASKKDSHKAWAARRKEGVPAEALLAGVQRYANYVLLSRTEPQFTKQPATFFGPGEHYKADWAVGATQTQKGVIHGKFGKQDYHKGVAPDGTF